MQGVEEGVNPGSPSPTSPYQQGGPPTSPYQQGGIQPASPPPYNGGVTPQEVSSPKQPASPVDDTLGNLSFSVYLLFLFLVLFVYVFSFFLYIISLSMKIFLSIFPLPPFYFL